MTPGEPGGRREEARERGNAHERKVGAGERRSRSGGVVGVAEGVAAAVRRRQREREPRVVLFGAGGAPRMVAPSAPGYDELLDVAEQVLDLAGERAREPRPRSSARSARRSEDADEPAA